MMTLQEYFKKVQSYKLSDAQKNDLYERILSKQQQTASSNPTISTPKTHTAPRLGIFSRAQFYAKVVGYTALLVLMGLSFYIPYLGQNRTNKDAGSVYADYVANIVKVQGTFSITSNGKNIDGSAIRNGDTVVLASGGSLVFHVNDNIEGKITGPASFIINRQNSGYAITMLHGDYLEVSSIGDSQTSPEIAVITPNEKIIAKANAGKKAHFVITKENNKQTVLNKADNEITVTKEENQKEEIILLAENNIRTTNKEGNYMVIPENQRFTATTGKEPAIITKSEGSYQDGFFSTLLAANAPEASERSTTDAEVDNDYDDYPEAGTTLATNDVGISKQSTIDRKALRDNLIPQFVWVDIKYITFYYLNGQELEYQRSFNSFLQRIQRTYTALGVPIPTADQLGNNKLNAFELKNLINLVVHLSRNIPEDTPEGNENTIKTLAAFFTKLGSHTFGEFEGQGLYLEDMFEKIQ